MAASKTEEVNVVAIFDEGYKQRLREYAVERIRKEGSARKWTTKIGLDKSTVSKWVKGTLVEPIQLASLEALACEREERPEETRNWLEGKGGLLEQVATSPPHMVAAVFALSFSMVQQKAERCRIPASIQSEIKMCSSAVGRIILAEIEASVQQGSFPNFDAAFKRFCEMCQFLNEERDIPIVIGMLTGRVDEAGEAVIGSVAIALEEFSGNPKYTFDYLASLENKTPTQEANGGCKRGRSASLGSP